MLSKIACLNRWKVANGCTCMLFSTVSSNCLPEQMQSRIGCICALFHQGSFQMFSKIACLNRWKVTNGCTCTFFSTVSSNYWPKQMQSRIGCICTLFHLREFSKIACLKGCKVTNGCTCTLFSTVSSIVCPKRCKVALVAFLHFFT